MKNKSSKYFASNIRIIQREIVLTGIQLTPYKISATLNIGKIRKRKFRARWNAISQSQKHKQPWEKEQFVAVYRSAKNKDC